MSEQSQTVVDPTGVPVELQAAVTLLVNAIVARHGSPAPVHAAEETIAAMRPSIELMWPVAVDVVVYDLLGGEAMKQIAVDIDPPIVLAPDFEPWFKESVADGRVRLERWYSYKQFLTHTKNFAPQVLDSLDASSSEVVDLLGDPNAQGSWRRRGLVIGDVQSGKTATYIGIVNKAADAGYKLVVLLTGATESLRQQTQYRIDEGFLGKDSTVEKHDKIIGVGKYPTQSKFLRGQGMTTHTKDFVTASFTGQAVNIDPNADHPYVFVVKKNTKPLENIISWIKGQFITEQFDIPMLVVDDESDYASVNMNYSTKGEKSPTAINARIRELLSLTTRSSYMAFTATPFANVFIDHNSYDEALQDDLFPHHYIFALASPSNYVGSKRYFGTSEDNNVAALVDITDAHPVFPAKHKSHLHVADIPDSLTDAILAFVVASAIRLRRGDKTPRSMLVNVSRFKNVQSQVYDLVALEFARIKNAIEIHAQPPTSGPDTHGVILRLAQSYETHFSDSQTTWPAVRNKLLAAVIDTTVELVNSSRDKKTDDTSRNMIAVGGDVLSRGLTVEGLTVSYFYRMVGAADTLLQMARWFGYRPGYDDIVRVWISPDVADQFRFVSDVSEELRTQIREMRELGKTPEDFGLMVRKHPETLAITAKKGASESRSMVISLSGRRIETIRIPANAAVLKGNRDAIRDFLVAIEEEDGGAGWKVPGGTVPYMGKLGVSKDRIADLLEQFRYDRGNLILANSLHKLIRDQNSAAFQDWTVCIANGSGNEVQLAPGLTLPQMPRRAVRYSTDGSSGTFRVSGTSARLAGSTDLARTYPHPGEPDLVEPAVYRKLPHPTLLIYPLEPNFTVKPTPATDADAAATEEAVAEEAWAKASLDSGAPLMALKIAIPGEPGAKSGDVVYLLNGPAIEEFSQDFTLDDTDAEDLDV